MWVDLGIAGRPISVPLEHQSLREEGDENAGSIDYLVQLENECWSISAPLKSTRLVVNKT